MLKGITLGQYLAGESPVHRLDPRTKILTVLIYMVAIFSARGWPSYLMLGLFAALAFAAARISPRYMLRALKPVIFILVFTVLINMFVTRGEVLYRIWRLTITREGLVMAATMGFRLSMLVITASLLTLTTPPIALTDGLEYLLGPGKRIGVPAHELALMLTIALRFIPTLIDEADKIMKAQMARGADFTSGGLVQRARALLPLLVPLFVSAFRRADDLATAMEARCYHGGEGRTRLRGLRLGTLDYVAGTVVLALVAAVFYLRFTGGATA